MNKDELEQAESRWNSLARDKGYRCSICSSVPIYDERELFFDRGMCGWCAHQADKDD